MRNFHILAGTLTAILLTGCLPLGAAPVTPAQKVAPNPPIVVKFLALRFAPVIPAAAGTRLT